jgi:Antidote-toxin recognition MazE, bacterial antitoxin
VSAWSDRIRPCSRAVYYPFEPSGGPLPRSDALYLVNSAIYQVGGLFVATAEKFKVSTSGQMSLPAAVRRRWHLEKGGSVEVLDLGFGVLTLPTGYRGRLLDQLVPAETHYAAVAVEDDPDLRSS